MARYLKFVGNSKKYVWEYPPVPGSIYTAEELIDMASYKVESRFRDPIFLYHNLLNDKGTEMDWEEIINYDKPFIEIKLLQLINNS